jgi:hypothetical protein
VLQATLPITSSSAGRQERIDPAVRRRATDARRLRAREPVGPEIRELLSINYTCNGVQTWNPAHMHDQYVVQYANSPYELYAESV